MFDNVLAPGQCCPASTRLHAVTKYWLGYECNRIEMFHSKQSVSALDRTNAARH